MRWRQIINESPKKYLPMFDAVIGSFPEEQQGEQRNAITRTIRSVEEALLREDRIVWFLRWSRLITVMALITRSDDDSPERPPLEQLFKRYAHELSNGTANRLADEASRLSLETMSHYAKFPASSLQQVVWQRQFPTELIAEFTNLENEWAEKQKQQITHDDYDYEPEKIIDFGNGWAWYDLHRASCDLEAASMGHCGNSAGGHDETVLSLRKDMGDGKFRPSVTFILDDEGEIGEMKGRSNKKPKPEYHSMIIRLLLDDRVTGIKGGGYLPENNFSLDDLPEAVKNKLLKKKPALREIADLWWDIRDISRVKKKPVSPKMLTTFSEKLEKDLRSRQWAPADIDMKREDIIIRRFADRQHYVSMINSYNAVLADLFDGELARLITQHETNISYQTAEKMTNAIRDDRFNRLFDAILPYDVDFIISDVEAEWRDDKICHVLSIDDYMREIHGRDGQSYSELHDLDDCRDEAISWEDVDGRFDDFDELDQALLAEVWWADRSTRSTSGGAIRPSPQVHDLVQEIIRLYSGRRGSSYRPHTDQFELPLNR